MTWRSMEMTEDIQEEGVRGTEFGDQAEVETEVMEQEQEALVRTKEG